LPAGKSVLEFVVVAERVRELVSHPCTLRPHGDSGETKEPGSGATTGEWSPTPAPGSIFNSTFASRRVC
jgi:hypothetical protein